MIPIEVERRIATYFFHRYLPDEVMMEIVDKLLPICIETEDELLDVEVLVHWAVDIIDEQLEDKKFK